MKSKLIQFILIISLSILFSCAGSKKIQKIDSPDDYYEQEPSVTETAITEKNSSINEENKISATGATQNTSQQPRTSSSPPPPATPATKPRADGKIQKNESNKTNTPPIEASRNTAITIEEPQVPPDVQEEMGDDSWAKDENKVKLNKKDKEKIKDSSPDDDRWGKE
ncbi:MAG: hypothetical protein ACP5QK_03875 [Myxococcota bacterium]